MDPWKSNELSLSKNLWSKSLWKDRKSGHWHFFCPLCRVRRSLTFRPKVWTLRHVLQVGITAALFTCTTWPWFGWKGIVSFVPFWIIFETVFRMKMRTALICKHCGFDPFLYMVDSKRARQELEEHWKKRFIEKGLLPAGSAINLVDQTAEDGELSAAQEPQDESQNAP